MTDKRIQYPRDDWAEREGKRKLSKALVIAAFVVVGGCALLVRVL